MKGSRAAVPHAGQEGLTMVLALAFLVIATIVASVSFRKVKGEMNGTSRIVKSVKSRLVAEAAVYVGLAVVQGVPGYTCVTHRPDGATRATGAGSCAAADLGKMPLLYSTGITVETSTGWLTTAPADSSEALSGTAEEQIRVKIWTPHADSVRVVGRAVVNGLEQDVQLFGNW